MAADDSYTAADERAAWCHAPRAAEDGELYSWPDGELVTPDKLAAWLKEDILLRRVVPPQKKPRAGKVRGNGNGEAVQVRQQREQEQLEATAMAEAESLAEALEVPLAEAAELLADDREGYVPSTGLATAAVDLTEGDGIQASYLPDEWLRIQDLLLTGAAYTPQNLRTRVDLLFGHYYLLRGENRRKMELADLSLLDYPPSEGPTPCSCLDWYRIKVLVGRDREQELVPDAATRDLAVGAQDAETHGTSLAQISQAGRWNQSVLCQAYLTHLPRQFMRIVAGFSASPGDYFLARAAHEPPYVLQRTIPHLALKDGSRTIQNSPCSRTLQHKFVAF
ncbi:centromere DNA-binding protein complex CBF3 subunit [Hirsutella rhossiliensis]